MANTFRLEFTIPEDDDDDSVDIGNAEIVFVLEKLKNRFIEDSSNHPRTIMDSNGNTVGSWEILPEES